MASKISTLRVLVTASTAPFKKALKSASATSKRFGKSIGAIGKRVARFRAVVGLAAVAGLTLLIKQAFSAIDAMGKLSGNIGIATDKLAGFHLAAELGGVSAALMDKSLIKMTRSVGQAGQGLSTQVRAFAQLGLTFDDLKNKTPSEQFEAIADGMTGIATASERAAVAADIFGRSGVELINILGGGAAALQAAQAEADAFGLSVSGIEAKQVEQANDAFLKVKRALTGIGRQIAIAVAPLVEHLSEKFIEAATAGGGIGNVVAKGMKIAGASIGFILDAIDSWEFAWLNVKSIILTSLQGMAKAFNDFVQIAIDGINKLLPASKELADVNRFAEQGLGLAAADVNKQIQDIWLGPTGQQRVEKFFAEVTAKSKKAAKKAVEEQKAAFAGVDAPVVGGDEKQKTREKRLQIGFRGEAFAAALRAGGGGVGMTPTERDTKSRQEKTNTVLEMILKAVQQQQGGVLV